MLADTKDKILLIIKRLSKAGYYTDFTDTEEELDKLAVVDRYLLGIEGILDDLEEYIKI